MTTHPGRASLRRAHRILLALMVGYVLVIRSWSADHHLPYLQYSNEGSNILQSVVVANRGPSAANLQRPTLSVHVLSAVDRILLEIGRLRGDYGEDELLAPPLMKDLGVGIAEKSTHVVIANRIVCAVMGAGTVLLTFVLAWQVFGQPWLALLAAAFASISALLTKMSIVVRPEIFLVFFVTLALVGAVRILQRGERRDYVLAGIGAGLAIGSKYNAGLVVLSVFAAHFLAPAERRSTRWLGLAALVCMLSFFLTTPYALIDPGRFLSDVAFEGEHYSSGHLGRDGHGWSYYLVALLGKEKLLTWVAAVGLVRQVANRHRATAVLLAFGVPYLAFISALPVKMERHVGPLLTMVCLWAASEIATWVQLALARQRAGHGRAPVFATKSIALALVGLGVFNSYRVIDQFVGENGRDLAREWIHENLPAGSVIAVESRTPWIDRSRFHVRRIPVSYSTSAVWLKTPLWYANQGFDYLVVSSRVQGLYSGSNVRTEETGALTITLNRILGAKEDDTSRYAGEIEGYRRLNRELEVLETFEGRQWGITILGVPDALRPARRVPLPPWFLWGGAKTGHPIGPDEDWPVEVWRGHDEPLTFCLPCLAGNPRVPAWVKRMRANGLITPPTQAELSHAVSNAGRFSR